jgi:hypothetical protein
MLRAVVAVLLLANAVFWVWSQGWLDDVVGVRSTGDREPQRLAQQLRPEIVRVLPADFADAVLTRPTASAGATPPTAPAASTPDGPAPPAPAESDTAALGSPVAAGDRDVQTAERVCLETDPYTDAELAAAEAVLAPLALGSDTVRKVSGPATTAWIVYMGRYANAEQLAEKQAQINRIRGVKYERVGGIPELDPGLSLGRYGTRAEAQAALNDLNQRGIRTARVVAITPPGIAHRLRVDAADAATKEKLLALKAPALRGGFRPCEPLSGAASAPGR